MWLLSKSARGAYHSSEAESKNSPPIARIRINDARSRGNRVIVYPMKPRTPGFWLIVATVGLLALLPMKAVAGMRPSEVAEFNYYKGKAEAGDPRVQWALGHYYAEGKGVPADPNEALKWYRKAADQGYARAKSSIGSCYENGLGVPKNEIEAVKWYRQAAEQGDLTAMSKMGLCYKNGVGVAQDEVEAATWFRKATEQRANLERKSAESGSAEAQYQMGARYYKGGEGIVKDDVEAVKWWLAAAGREGDPDQWDIMAKYRLGFMYEKGQGVAVDVVEAARWWRRAAEIGHAGARFSMGYCYQVGQGVPKDAAEATKWFRLASMQGNRDAQLWLARDYLGGEGVPKDAIEAYAYLSLVSQTKNEDADKLLASLSEKLTPEERLKGQQRSKEIHISRGGFQRDIIQFTSNGTILKRNTQNVAQFESVRARAEQGDSNAQSQLATYYQRNEVVLKDDFEAEKWLRKSAAHGKARSAEDLERALKPANEKAEFKAFIATADQADASVQNKLGLCYLNGKGVKTDFAVAVGWFRKAADQNNANAQYNLGICYRSGWGVTKDQAEAISLFRKAAELGDAEGQHQLGVCYQVGIGMPKDQVQADIWLGKAAVQNVAAYRKDAEEGDSAAQFNLGQSYRDGKGVARDPNEAVKWYRKSAVQGNARALFMMGNSYLYGEGVAKDKVEAIAYWEVASPDNQSARQSLGFLKLATFPLTTWQGERRAKELQKEIDANIAAKKPGKALEQEIEAKREAKRDDERAKEPGVPSPKPQTPEEQKLAAERGDAEAQYMLGVRYYMTGMGGMNVKDQAEAIKWLLMASNQGNSNAQFMLAHCYELGQCVPMDKIEAYAYWKIGFLVNKSQQREGGPLSSDELRRGEQRAKELQKEIEAKIAAKKAGK